MLGRHPPKVYTPICIWTKSSNSVGLGLVLSTMSANTLWWTSGIPHDTVCVSVELVLCEFQST